jgi:competence protein ComEC
VTAWLLPLSAAAFWGGLMLSPLVAARTPVLGWLALGGVFVLAAGGFASRREDAARRAGIVDQRFEPRAISAIALGRAAGRRPVALAVSTAIAGVAMLGIGWGGVARARVGASLLRHVGAQTVTVDGLLRTDPTMAAPGWSAILDARLVSWGGAAFSAREPVWVSGDAALSAVRGDRVRVTGTAQVPEDDGFRTMLERRGIAVELRADEVTLLGGPSDPVLRAAQWSRAFIERSIRGLFPQREAGLLLGLALGDESQLDESIARDFQAAGLGHMLVVSGENVAMILAPILCLAMWLRFSRWPTFALAAGTVLFFVVLTGGEPSVMRAGVMAALSLLGVLLGRPRSTASVLAGAVMLLLVLDPTLVWSIGFQLSVVATGGMVAMATTIADRFRFLPRALAVPAGATVAAQLAVTPLLLLHFHEVPVIAVAANVLAFPALAPALLLGLLAGGVGAVSMSLARPIAAAAMLPMRYLELLADRLAKAPAVWITSEGGVAVFVVGSAIVVALAWWLRARRRVPRPALIAAMLVVATFVWSGAVSSGAPGGLVVRFFAVGQGDAALVSSPVGANVLIDGGPDPTLVATKLASLGVKRLDLLVATHPHEDHYVGVPEVLARVPVGLVLTSGCSTPESESAPYRSFLRAVRVAGVPDEHPIKGDVFVVGDLRFDVVSPDRCWSGSNSDANNDSLVLRLTWAGVTVLFANEPEAEAQQAMLDNEAWIASDVLNVPHHGAATSIDSFFEAVDERVAVVSVGPNGYGHPVPSTLEALRATGARVFRTDRSGDVVVSFAGASMTVQTGRGRSVVVPLG